jgi:hypothetical protein
MNRSTNKPLQKAAKAFLHRLEGAGITLGSPRYDEALYMECTKGFFELRFCKTTGRVSCLLADKDATMEIERDGKSMCLNETARSTGTFQPCSGFQDAVDRFLASQGWI